MCLHGGNRGLDTQDWTKIDPAQSALFASTITNATAVIHRFVSPAGSDGFPLQIAIEMLVQSLEEEAASSQEFIIRARIEDDGLNTKEELAAGTPVNLTIHWGFNCGDFDRAGRHDVLDHKLFINVSP